MCDLMWTGEDFENCELISNPKSPNGWCDCCLFKLLCVSLNGKHLICFWSQSTVFKFLWHRVDPIKNIEFLFNVFRCSVVRIRQTHCSESKHHFQIFLSWGRLNSSNAFSESKRRFLFFPRNGMKSSSDH